MPLKTKYSSQNYVKFLINQINDKNYYINGGAYMAQKFEKTVSASSLPKLTINSEIQKEFNNIDKMYESRINEWLTKKNELDTQASNIKAQAEQNLNQYKTSNIESIEAKYGEKQVKLDEKIATAQKDYQDDVEDLDAEKLDATNSLNYGSIEKGWRNSSIFDNTLNKINSTYQSELQDLQEENNIKMSSLQFQKELLETQKENALENFDIAYAKKLNDEIASLTKEMEQSNLNAYTYESINNELSNINSQVQQHKAVTLINYLAQKSKSEAASILSSGKQELIDTIGTPWYNNVLTWNNTRK